MHVIVLAAGRGSRLNQLADDRSKWLLPVGHATIADRQLAALEQVRGELGPGAVSVTVVTGHAAQGVADYVDGQPVELLHNPEFLARNNWWSVLVGLRALPADDRPVVVMNGDLCAQPDWLAQFLLAAAGSQEQSLVAVDVERRLTDESMKVATVQLPDGRQRVQQIGKVDITDPVGEYVGLLMFRGTVRAQFTEALARFETAPEHSNEWYEGAVRTTSANGTDWVLWPTPSSEWFEIDDEADHAAAIALLGQP